METIVLAIDGKTITAPAGASILEAADRSGIKIPRLCHHPALKPAGACRLCLVEEETTGRLMAACVTPAAQGQAVRTQTPRVVNHRRNIVRLMMAEHPESCVVCDKGNRCGLRQVAAALGIGDAGLYPMPNFKPYEQANPFITRDLSKCILCGKCIRADHDLVAVGAIDFAHRGFGVRPATVHHTDLMDSDCTFCGTCISICPTGALGLRHPGHVGTPELEADTTCGFCPVGCRLALGVSANRVVAANPSPARGTVNGATLCVRGHFAHDYLGDGNRLPGPLMRKKGADTEATLAPAPWPEAIEAAVEGLLRVKAAHGPQSIGFLGAPRCTNEENYLFQKIARVSIQTNNIDGSGHLSGQPLLAAFDERTRGRWRQSPLANLETAEAILVLGADPTHSTPVAGYCIKRAARNGASLIVADPKRTRLAAMASLWLPVFPGTDLAWLNGLTALIVGSNGYDRRFIDRHTEGFSILRYGLAALDLEDTCRTAGIPKATLETAAALLKGKKLSVVLGNGILRQPQAGPALDALANLLLLTAGTDSEASGIYFLAGENNHVGALHMGAVPDRLPGHGRLDIEGIRKKYEMAWQTPLSPDPGLDLVRMIEAAENGRLKALYILGENPLRALPEPARVKKALANLDFLLVQDILSGDTVHMADVVLSGAAFCEKGGTFTNLEGRVQALSPVVPPPGHAKPDWKILDAVWARLGGAPHEDMEHIRLEISRLAPMYADAFSTAPGWVATDTEGGPTSFTPVVAAEKAPTAEGYPLTAIFGSVRHHAGSGTRTAASRRISSLTPPPVVEVSEEDATSAGLKNGDHVLVHSASGSLGRTVTVSIKIQPGQVFLPATDGPGAALALLRLADTARGWNTCPVRLEKEGPHETDED
jgi:formate dehydrogenase alpha subunit